MIEFVAVSKSYGHVAAVSELTFAVPPGLITGFLGMNGAGKSTTMAAALGLIDAEGEVTFDSRLLSEVSPKRHEIGFMLSPACLNPRVRVGTAIKAACRARALPFTAGREIIDELELGPHDRKRVHQLSLGLTQRLAFALALVGSPRYIVLDEPLTGLDVEAQELSAQAVRRRADAGASILLSSHQMAEVASLCDRVVVIANGQKVAETTMTKFVSHWSEVASLVRSSDNRRLQEALGSSGAKITPAEDGQALLVRGLGLKEIGELAHRLDLGVYELTSRSGGLHEAFLRAVRADEASDSQGAQC